VEGLIRPPLLPSQLERANGLALAIARNAPDAVAMLGTRLVRAIQDARAAGESADIRPIALIVAQVRRRSTSLYNSPRLSATRTSG